MELQVYVTTIFVQKQIALKIIWIPVSLLLYYISVLHDVIDSIDLKINCKEGRKLWCGI